MEGMVSTRSGFLGGAMGFVGSVATLEAFDLRCPGGRCAKDNGERAHGAANPRSPSGLRG
jgi:hypothetical protein